MLQFRIIVHRFEPTELAACVVVAIAVAAAVWLAFRFRDAAGVSAHRELRDSQQSLEDRIAEREAEAAMAADVHLRDARHHGPEADGARARTKRSTLSRGARRQLRRVLRSGSGARRERSDRGLHQLRAQPTRRGPHRPVPRGDAGASRWGGVPVHRRQIHREIRGLTDSRIPLEEEIELNAPGAAPRWVHYQIIPLGDGVAVTSRDISDRRHAEEELRALTLVDELTGLYNRRGFRMLAEQHLRLAKRGGPSSMLFCFDLDQFKAVNDVYGHVEGDVALHRVGVILRNTFRDSDIIARLGGDEFAVFAVDCGEIRDQLVNRVAMALAANNTAAARPYTLSFSMGFARLDPLARPTLDDLIAEADASLYEVKRRRVPHALSA